MFYPWITLRENNPRSTLEHSRIVLPLDRTKKKPTKSTLEQSRGYKLETL